MLIWKDLQAILNGNVRHSLGLVEGRSVGLGIPSGGIAKGSPRILEGETGTALLERDSLKWPPPAPHVLLIAGKAMGEGWEDRWLQMGPFLGQSNLTPVALEGMRVCDLLFSWPAFWEQKWRSTIYIKTKARPSAAWQLKKLPGPLPPESPGESKADGS